MPEFKPLTLADVSLLLPMMQEFYAIDGYPIDSDKSALLFSEFIANPELGRTWLIYSEGILVGYIILTFVFSFEYGGKIAFVDELYLSEKARGRGIGKASISYIQAEAAKLSLKLLYLEVEEHNSNAQKLYIAAGFDIHNRKIMKYRIN